MKKILEPAVRGRGAEGNCFPLDWLNSEFWIEPSTNIRNIRNLHREFEIQMLVENHKSRCATFASGFTNDLTPPIGELFGALERSNGPIIPHPLSLALECLKVCYNTQHTDRHTDMDNPWIYLVYAADFRKCAFGATTHWPPPLKTVQLIDPPLVSRAHFEDRIGSERERRKSLETAGGENFENGTAHWPPEAKILRKRYNSLTAWGENFKKTVQLEFNL